jgi:hypothetical protein
LLLLTGCRLNEVAGMRRSELSDDLHTWTLSGDRTKNHRTHVVPLPQAARELLASVDTDGDIVFTTNGKTPVSGWSKTKKRLDHLMKIPAWRLHDLRRTAATGMAEIGIAPHIIEAALNHISGAKAGVAGIYNRATYSTEKKAALERWARTRRGIDCGPPIECHTAPENGSMRAKNSRRVSKRTAATRWLPQDSDVDRVLSEMRPLKGYEKHKSRQNVISSLRTIARFDPTTPSDLKEKMRSIVATLRKARTAIKSLPDNWRYGLGMDISLLETDRIIAQTQPLATSILKPSGNAGSNAARKLIAAERAFDLLLYCGGRQPTLSDGGTYLKLTNVLFEIATGKPENCERECYKYFKLLEDEGFSDAEARKKIARHGKLADTIAPNWLRIRVKARYSLGS